jgi:trk system potassium uptake protein TrkH
MVAGLIVLGGLGPTVVRDVLGWMGRWRPRRLTLTHLTDARRIPRLRAQTKVSLSVTAVLIVVGALGLAATEWSGALAGASLEQRVSMPLFQSITARTAGFDTVPVGTLRDTSLVLLIVLMVIGASPVSTGGGIKTVTVGVLWATMRALVKGRNVELFNRGIPVRIVRASVSVLLIYVVLATVGVFLLSATDPGIPVRDRVFELISALGTVGLSTGHTAEFSSGGQIVLCLAMFAGRVGPLTLVITLFRGHPAPRYSYPEEPLVLG